MYPATDQILNWYATDWFQSRCSEHYLPPSHKLGVLCVCFFFFGLMTNMYWIKCLGLPSTEEPAWGKLSDKPVRSHDL